MPTPRFGFRCRPTRVAPAALTNLDAQRSVYRRPPPLTGTRIGAHAVEFSKTARLVGGDSSVRRRRGPCPERAVDHSASLAGLKASADTRCPPARDSSASGAAEGAGRGPTGGGV